MKKSPDLFRIKWNLLYQVQPARHEEIFPIDSAFKGFTQSNFPIICGPAGDNAVEKDENVQQSKNVTYEK